MSKECQVCHSGDVQRRGFMGLLDGANETVRDGAAGPDTKHYSTECWKVERDV